jgi:hypothetical protein
MVIPSVVLMDLVFAAAAAGLYRLAPSRWSRRLVTALFVYTLVETAFHVPMEDIAGQVLFAETGPTSPPR